MKFSFENLTTVEELKTELTPGLEKLTFVENVEGFIVTLNFNKREKRNIPNEVDFIPSGFIILDMVGAGNISRDYYAVRQQQKDEFYPTAVEWTTNTLYLVNTGEACVTKIFFMR